MNRGGKPDTWYYRVLKRIPEHFEEVFYEVAMVTLPNGDRVKTMEESREIAMWFIEHFGWLFANEYEFVKQGLTGEERRIERLKRSKSIMNRIKKELEKYERSGYKHLGKQIKRALVYAKKEWHAFETVLQNGDVEVSNNLCEQMMKHIKMNLKNCLNIGSEESALDYAFMFSAIESCDINRLSPEAYLRKLILGLHNKTVEKKQLLPCFIRF